MPPHAMPPQSASSSPGKRQRAAEARRRAILDAALEVFAADGFSAARLDDIASRAKVAKGTLYLFSRDKQDLFEQVARDAVTPLLQGVTALTTQPDLPFAALLTGLYGMFETHVLTTSRRELIRLVIAEGGRFPAISEFYHREIVSRGLPLIANAAARAHARGEISSDMLVRFPQIVIAPLLTAGVWRCLFEPYQPLDAPGMLSAYRDMLLAPANSEAKKP
ncbi:MAG: TetR/AcrR family transcriptional regulator [Rhodoblastus sp.]